VLFFYGLIIPLCFFPAAFYSEQGWNVCDGAEDVVFSAYIKAVKPGL